MEARLVQDHLRDNKAALAVYVQPLPPPPLLVCMCSWFYGRVKLCINFVILHKASLLAKFYSADADEPIIMVIGGYNGGGLNDVEEVKLNASLENECPVPNTFHPKYVLDAVGANLSEDNTKFAHRWSFFKYFSCLRWYAYSLRRILWSLYLYDQHVLDL